MLEKLALVKSTPAPHHSVSGITLVSKVIEKKILTSGVVENEMIDSSSNVETEVMTGERISDETIVRGWKKKQSPKVKSGKRLKSALEQATGKKRQNKNSSNKSSSVATSKNDGHNTNIHNGNPSKVIGPQPPSCPLLPYFPQPPQNFNVHSGIPNTTVLQPPPCPPLPSLPQFSENYQVGLPNWSSSRTPLHTTYPTREQAVSCIPTSQLMALMKPNVQHNINYLPQLGEKNQSISTSLMGLLQAQMQQPLESGSFLWKDSTPNK